MNQVEAANLLSVTARTLNDWAREDPPIPVKKSAKGELNYEGPEIVRWRTAREVNKAIRISNNWQEERQIAESREAVAKAELREIELAKVKGDLLLAAEVEREWTGEVLMVRQALLNIPHQLAVAIQDGMNYAEKKTKAQALIDALLHNLAGADPGPNPAPPPVPPAPKRRPAAAQRKTLVPKLKPGPKPARVVR